MLAIQTEGIPTIIIYEKNNDQSSLMINESIFELKKKIICENKAQMIFKLSKSKFLKETMNFIGFD